MTDRPLPAPVVAPGGDEAIPVVPAVLVWARTSLGLDEATAARRVGVVVGTLRKWESGELPPTIRQLRKMAAAYKRPLAVLLLPEPAKDFSAMRDFRAGTDGTVSAPSVALTAEYRRALSQREVMLEIDELGGVRGEEYPPLPALGLSTADEEAGAAIRQWLNVPSRWPKPDKALQGWVDAAEARGVLVVHTQKVPGSEMSGFSVSEWPHPVIAVNGSDPRRRRLFTIAHELAHLALRAGGLCDTTDDRRIVGQEDRIELKCNSIAAAALIPVDELVHISDYARAKGARDWTLTQLDGIAAPFGASTEATLLRLIRLGKADWSSYRRLKPEFQAAYDAGRAKQRDSKSGPSFYTVKARDLGKGYVRTVLGAFRGRMITSLDAADYLDVRFEQIPKLEEAL